MAERIEEHDLDLSGCQVKLFHIDVWDKDHKLLQTVLVPAITEDGAINDLRHFIRDGKIEITDSEWNRGNVTPYISELVK